MGGSHQQVEAGFTLIELVIVFAISAFMLIMLLNANSSTNNREGFTSAMDQLQGNIKGIQNEASATISDRTGGSTGNSPYTVFGKAMLFSPNSAQYTVATLIGQTGDATDDLVECDAPAVTLPDDMRNKDAARTAIIFRNTANTAGQVYYASGFSTVSDAGGVCESPGVATSLAPVKGKLGQVGFAGSSSALVNRLKSLAQIPKNWVAPSAFAVGADLLNPNSYTLGGPFGGTGGTINFSDPADATQTGTFTVNPQDNTITRSFAH